MSRRWMVLLVPLAACAPEPGAYQGVPIGEVEDARVHMEYRADVYGVTGGFAVHDGGDGVAQMGSLLCDFDNVGWVGSDYTYPADDPQIDDVDGGVVVVRSSSGGVGIHAGAWNSGLYDGREYDTTVDGAVAARSALGELVALVESNGRCEVAWPERGLSTAVDAHYCGASFDVDDGATAYLANDQGLLAVTPAGADRIGGPTRLVHFDAATQLLYVSQSAGGTGPVSAPMSTLAALELDGSVAWSRPIMGAPPRVLTDAGDVGAVVVARGGDFTGGLVFIDGRGAQVIGAEALPTAPDWVSASPSGAYVGLVAESVGHVMRLVED